MAIVVEATVKNGGLKLNEPVVLAEGTPVRVIITPVEGDRDPLAGVVGICETGRSDGAANHDKYLAEKRRP